MSLKASARKYLTAGFSEKKIYPLAASFLFLFMFLAFSFYLLWQDKTKPIVIQVNAELGRRPVQTTEPQEGVDLTIPLILLFLSALSYLAFLNAPKLVEYYEKFVK